MKETFSEQALQDMADAVRDLEARRAAIKAVNGENSQQKLEIPGTGQQVQHLKEVILASQNGVTHISGTIEKEIK